MKTRLALVLAAASVLAATVNGIAACSSHTSTESSYSQSFHRQLNREMQLEPVLVACLARHGIIPAKDLDKRWYRDGRVIDNKYFIAWLREFNGFPVKVNGTSMHLDDVARKAATTGAWPTKLCGRLPSLPPP